MSVVSLPDPPCASNPLEFRDWDAALETSAKAWVFHTQAWARVLSATYGHLPCYFSSRPDDLRASLLAVMEVASPLTGRRGVSLPFTDFCPALANDAAELSRLHATALNFGRSRCWRYLECRGNTPPEPGAIPFVEFYGHRLDLQDLEAAERRLSPAVRRGIRKAERAGLKLEVRTDAGAVRQYWTLHVATRRGHGLPPQPFSFFANLHEHLLSCGRGFIVLASTESRAVAGSVFLNFGAHAVYKFGASDRQFQHLRPNNLVMWTAIRHLAERGCEELHLGRTSLFHEGLRRFKLGFGAAEERLQYYRFDYRRNEYVRGVDRVAGWHNLGFRVLPLRILELAGRIIYPHLS